MILGKVLKFPSNLDEKLQKQIMDCSDGLLTAVGDTMCAHDFYEGMSRVWTKQVGYERYLQTCKRKTDEEGNPVMCEHFFFLT